MADAQANIGIGVDISEGLAAIRQLQREISAFHTSMAKGGALANAESMRLSQNLINTINASGQFSAGMTRIASSTESFTNALEKNKLSMTQYFRYAGGASRSFGKMFSREFNTVNRVAQERVKDLQTQYISMGRDANGALQAIKVRPLALDMNDLGTKVQMVAQRQQIFNQLLKQGSTNLLNFGKNTQWAGRQLMVGFTIPLTIFGATAAREFQKLEEQAVKFRRVYGDMFTTDAETEQALSNIRELADEFTKYGIAVEKTVGLAAKVAQMGNVGADLTAQVTQATRLAVLGGLEQEEALDTTISLTNAFGIAAEDLAGKIAFLNAAENQTILAIEDFNEAIPKAGSVVQQLGGDVEDLAFMLTAMREGGINASQAANAIKSSLGRMINPTAAATEKLAGFGIDIVGIVESNVGDLRSTITQLGYALDGLDPLDRARAIETLFGKFQFARMSTMFSNIVKEGSQANRVLQLTTNSTQELAIIAERELKRVEESPAFKLQKEMEKLKAALAPIGAEFIKAVTPIVQFGTKILKAFNEMGDGGKQFIVILTAVAGVVAPAALMAFGLIANGVANLIKFFALLGRGFMSLSGSSKVLGTGTEYLTQQQIEAAAVAASLGQSHSNLIQVFTAEAGAVRNLAGAYREALIAQGAFGGSAAAARVNVPKPKGYAQGGLIRGPGTGTSDSIIAAVSNKEFIVNAEATKENLPLLEALNSGKIKISDIPGFSRGGPTSQESAREAAVRQATRVMTKAPPTGVIDRIEKLFRDLPFEDVEAGLSKLTNASISTAGELVQATQDLQNARLDRNRPADFAHVGSDKRMKSRDAVKHESFKSLTETQQQTVQDAAKFAPDADIRYTHGYGFDLKGRHNTALSIQNQTSGANPMEVAQDFASRGVDKWDEAVSLGGGDLQNDQELREEFIEYDNELARILDNLDDGIEHLVDTVEDKKQLLLNNPDLKPESIGVIEEYEEQASSKLGPRGQQVRQNAKDRVRAIRVNYDPEARQRIVDAAAKGDPDAQRLATSMGLTSGPGGEAVQRKGAKRTFEASSGKKVVPMPDSGTDEKKLEENLRSVGVNAAQSLVDGIKTPLEMNSPSKKMFGLGQNAADSLVNGFEAGMADEAPNPLAPPKPPEVGYMPDDTSLRGKLRMVKEDAIQKFNDSAPGQYLGKKVSKLSGTALTDSEGNITYDPNTDPDAWASQISDGAPMPVRVVDGFEIDPEFQETMERGTANTEDLNTQIGQQVDAVEENTGTVQRTAEEQKEIDKTNKRQNRGALAGKMMMGLGGVTMAAGMATQVDGVIGETAQKIVGPLGALTGILPVLTALGPVIGSLVAVIGAGVALWYLYNKAMDNAYDKTYELTRAMGTSAEAMQKFADFAGTVTSGELMDRKREESLSIYSVAPGKTTFGSSFVADEAGQEFVGQIKSSMQELGRDKTINMVFQQMATAVSQGILTPEQARSVVGNLGIAMNDYAFSAEINAKMVSIVGVNGENLLENPMALPVILAEQQRDMLEKDVAEYEADRAVLAFEEVGFQESTDRVLDDALGYFTLLNPVLGTLYGTLVQTDEAYQEAIAAERQRRIDSGEVEGWWEETLLALTPDTTIANEMLQSGLGSVTAGVQNSLEAQQSAVDAIRLQSEQKIADAIAEGASYDDIAKLREDEADAIQEAIDKIRESTQASIDFIKNLSEADQETAKQQQRDRIKNNLDENVDRGAFGTAFDANFKTGDFGVNFTISSAFESGQITFEEFQYLAELDDATKKIYYDITTNLGAGEAGQVVQMAQNIKDEDVKARFELSFSGLEGDALDKAITASEEITRMSTLFGGDTSIPINFMLNNTEETQAFMDKMQQFAIDAEEGGFDANIELFTSIFGAEEVESAQRGILANQAEFDALPDEMQLRYASYYTLFMDMAVEDGALLDMAEAATGLTGEAAVAKWVMQILPSMVDNTSAPDTEPEDTGSSGGGEQESYDDILVGLRNVRQATIDMKRGWDGMNESIQKFLDTGSVGFNGLANQMRRLGVGEGLIERITGMDPDEYEKRKAELFVFDEAGNIIGTTQKLQNLGAAMNKLALGEYVNSQQSFIENTKNQFTAMQMLTAQGLSFVEAYEMVQDQALATAIAMGATREEIDELIRITERMSEMQEKYNRLSEKEQAAKAVKESNKEFQKRVNILSKLSKEQGKYSDEEIDAVLNDPNLGTLFLNPKIDPKTLKQALENARRAADLELSIKVSTEEGKEGLFNELVAEVQDEFNRQEAKIDIDFRLANKADQDIVNEAQNRIAAIQYAIDDYEAQLKGIEDQEQVINEKYDDRYKALEEVAAANERINRLKAAELDVADALSRGDIAAAARAQQELRATEAQNRAESQKEMLQRQQEAELARVRSESGMSREDLEKKIKALQDEIFGIEETSLEPAQERIRLAEVQKQAQIDALDVSGKTRDEWDQIANLTDIATQNTDEFAKNVERALALYEYFVNDADLPLELFGGELLQQVKSLGVDVDKEIEKRVAKVAASNPAPAPQGGNEKAEPKPNVALGEFARDALKNLVTSGTTDSLTTLQKAVLGMMPKEEAQTVIQTSASSALRNLTSGGTLSVAEKALLGLNRDYKTGAELRAPTPSYSGASSTRRHTSTGSTWTSNPSQGGGATQRSTPVYTTNPSLGGGAVKKSVSQMSTAERKAIGLPYSSGGIIKPMRFSVGGKVMGYAAGGYGFGVSGSDNIPAILTPGEFVVRKRAVQEFGMKNLEKINNGEYSGGSVYNYSLAVNVKSDADPNKIAKTVMREIKRVDSQRVRGNRF